MARFCSSCTKLVRTRSPVAMFLWGIGLGVCFIVLTLKTARFQTTPQRTDLSQRTVINTTVTDSGPTTPSLLSSSSSSSAAVTREATVPPTGVHVSRKTARRLSATPVPEKVVVGAGVGGGSGRETQEEWWEKMWNKSGTAGRTDFVGDKPLIPEPCNDRGAPKGLEKFRFVEPRKYLSKTKNPCWYDNSKQKTRLRCLPYFYIAGVAKGGTTDLWARLRLHPDVLEGTQKEYHWWDRQRFFEGEDRWSFDDYIDHVNGDDIKILENELKEKKSSNKIYGDGSGNTIFHPLYWPYLDGNQRCQEPRFVVGQHIYHAYPQAKIILTLRHPTSRLYSRFLSRTTRVSYLRKADAADFHRFVQEAVKEYTDCFNRWSIRHCTYNGSLFQSVTTHIIEGFYAVHLADWLRVWPREQLHIMRYEDYGGHEAERIAEIYHFLGLTQLNGTLMEKVAGKKAANQGTAQYKKIGHMLPETKRILDDFYQPFITRLAEILNDKRFLWLDKGR